VVKANETRKSLYDQLNADGDVYDLYEIPKDQYSFYLMRNNGSVQEEPSHLLEA
jgi:hypothetical protein